MKNTKTKRNDSDYIQTRPDTNYENFIKDMKKLLDANFGLNEIVVIRNGEEQHITKEDGK